MSEYSFQSSSLKVLWQAVSADPMDFQSWTALLSQVEALGSPEDAHQAYDGFLRQFPLCFGYWKKYASMAHRNAARSASTTEVQDGTTGGEVTENANAVTAGAARAREIFELAVTTAPYCLELWEAFVGNIMEGPAGGKQKWVGDVDEIRRVYERALEAVGDNPGAGGIWRRCIAFEEAQVGEIDAHISGAIGELNFDLAHRHVEYFLARYRSGDHPAFLGGKGGEGRRIRRMSRLYERAFGYRLADLEILWTGFRDLVDRASWEELAPSSGAGVGKGSSNSEEAAAAVAAKEGVAAFAAVQAMSKGGTKTEMKDRFVKILEDKRKASLRGRARRESFEKRITRPHFHVKPLDDAQLCAWSEFLDFEISQQDEGGGDTPVPSPIPASDLGGNTVNSAGRKRRRGSNPTVSRGCDVERLFGRCLVPCASYWWLWERYALWKESVWGVEAALEVAERACSPFLQWRPEALFFRAELLERVGRTDDARGVYRRVLSEVAPGLVEAACKLACFERRCGDRQAAEKAYRLLLPPPLGSSTEASLGWEETTETTRPYLYMQLARFQHRILGDSAAARTTFRAAVADVPSSRELWLAFLEFEVAQPQALHSGRVEAAFRMAVEEGGQGAVSGSTGGVEKGEEARRLTVEDRADLWEWFEEFVEDLSMDVAKVMHVRAEHRAWTQAHGTSAHEAAAATAAAGAGDDLIEPSDNKIETAEDWNGSAGASRRRGPGKIGHGAGKTGGGGVGAAAGAGWSADGSTGSAGDRGKGRAFASQQTMDEQWSAYYQQQQVLQQVTAGASATGITSTMSPPYNSLGQQQQQQLYGSQAVADSHGSHSHHPQYRQSWTG